MTAVKAASVKATPMIDGDLAALPVCAVRFRVASVMDLYLFDFRSAEQARRTEDENQNQDAEGGDILVFGGEISRPECLDEADQHAAQHGARQRADAAEH